MTVHDLVGIPVGPVDFAPQLRGALAPGDEATARADTALFERLCEDYLALEDLIGSPLRRASSVPEYDVADLRPAGAGAFVADQEGARLGLGDAPVADILDLLDSEVGLRVFVHRLASPRVAGMYAYTVRLGGCVLINGSHPRVRQAWTAAHEYAHYLTTRTSAQVLRLEGAQRRRQAEHVADAFARSFLMPPSSVRRRFLRTIRARADFVVSDLLAMAGCYGVSAQAMSLCLEELGLVSRGTWDQLAKDGFRPSEMAREVGYPTGHAPRLRLPARYEALAVYAYEAGLITESRLAELLRCSRVEAREKAAKLAESVDVDESGTTQARNFDLTRTLVLART